MTVTNPSIAPKYYVLLRDWTGTKLHMFDDWDQLEYQKILNDVGYHTFVKMNPDIRMGDVGLDTFLEVHRSVPGVGLTDYADWIGFNRTPVIDTDENGLTTFTIAGLGLNSLIARAQIGYKGGTIYADKDGVAETVMKEYVRENIGVDALAANGRQIDNVMPGLTVEGSYGHGVNWVGSRPFKSLLDVLKEIGLYSQLDFNIMYLGGEFGPASFVFVVREVQLGDDLTDYGLNPITGKNWKGNDPVIFSMAQGNVAKAVYTYDRMQESNVIFVLGDGEGATQEVTTRTDPTRLDSPWNQWETSRPFSGFQYEREAFGDANLVELRAMEKYEFQPRHVKSCVYGFHYRLGDMVVVLQGGVKRYKRLTGVKTTVTNDKEELEFTFADIAYAR